MSEEELDTTITYYPPGVEEVELRTVVYGEDPMIIIEPTADQEGLNIILSMIDHATAGWMLALIATTLEKHYGQPEFDNE